MVSDAGNSAFCTWPFVTNVHYNFEKARSIALEINLSAFHSVQVIGCGVLAVDRPSQSGHVHAYS